MIDNFLYLLLFLAFKGIAHRIQYSAIPFIWLYIVATLDTWATFLFWRSIFSTHPAHQSFPAYFFFLESVLASPLLWRNAWEKSTWNKKEKSVFAHHLRQFSSCLLNPWLWACAGPDICSLHGYQGAKRTGSDLQMPPLKQYSQAFDFLLPLFKVDSTMFQ